MDRFERLTPLLEEFVEKGPPGCACIVARRGGVVYEKYLGYADRERKKEISPETIYRLFSNSKPITCTAALILYERGAYLLSDPLSDYLPEFKDTQVYRSAADNAWQASPAKAPIRIADLFTMTSGLCYAGDSPETARRTRDVLQDLDQKEKDGSKYDIRDMSRALAGIPLAFDPGAGWMYGTSHDVLGALIEVLSGKTLGRFMQDEIFDPLGMNDTSFRLPEEKRARLCSLYDRSADGTLTKDTDQDAHYRPDALLETGGGGLLSTLGDHSRFAQMLGCGGLLHGTQILGRKTVQLMSTNHLKSHQFAEYNWDFLAGYGYGLGVRVMMDRAAAGSNGSVGEFGWGGLAGTWALVDPVEELSVVYAQQMMPSLEERQIPRLRNVIYGAL
jgi:CubicO group peptidase (beta-lactamase class C family)